MRLKYITSISLPSEDANRIQIIKMSESLSKIIPDFNLIIGKQFSDYDKIKNYYNITHDFKIIETGLDVKGIAIDGQKISFKKIFTKLKLRHLYMIYKQIKSGDVVFARDQLTIFLLIIFKFFKNFKLCYEVHNLSNTFLNKIIFKKVDKLVSISKGISDDIKLRFGYNSLILYDGVDNTMFKPLNKLKERKKWNISKDKKIVLYVGNFYKWKGVDTLIKSFYYLKDVNLILVGGDNNNIDRIKNLIKTKSNIHLIHKQPYYRIPSLMSCADILVITNTKKEKISEKYTSPLKAMEYASMKIPIIASDVDSLKNILQDKVVYFKADDETDLAEKINQVIKTKSNYKIRGAYELSRKYTWDERARILINYLK